MSDSTGISVPATTVGSPLGLDAANVKLPSVRTSRTPEEVVTTLEKAARKGKMPGFRAGAQRGEFSTLAFGAPFDHDLIGKASVEAGQTLLTFRLKMLQKLPAIYVALIAVSVWPGVWLTESMLNTYFSWYRLNIWWTCAWYIPLTVGPVPWMWKKWVTGSTNASMADALETIPRIAEICGGTVVP